MSVGKAIFVGQLVINLPVVAIIIIALSIGLIVSPSNWQIFAILGSIVGWVWWSYTVPPWRDWAHHRGVDQGRLQKFAVRTGLTWPKGSLFERTEFRRKK